jgi:HNH endonuclease
MKLFDPRAEQLLEGVGIDQPFNAMTLAVDLHRSFGNLKWYFEEEPEVCVTASSPTNGHCSDSLVT